MRGGGQGDPTRACDGDAPERGGTFDIYHTIPRILGESPQGARAIRDDQV
jgi:hypothetical protein